eukprot:4378850-Lingulodinium_polyedra.AAC.1
MPTIRQLLASVTLRFAYSKTPGGTLQTGAEGQSRCCHPRRKERSVRYRGCRLEAFGHRGGEPGQT